MRKILSSFVVVCALAANIPFVSAQNDEIISETVKIISYDLTSNGHVIEKSLASGTLISKDGLVLTNHHVVVDENDDSYEAFAVCTVTDTQEKPDCLFTASLVAKEKSTDMAVIKINPTDVLGNSIPEFRFLNYKDKVLPAISDKIEITGFPGIGGETLTNTEGQISGYEEREGITHLKTDATISAGNSGGTAKDKNGNFIGVPSYIRSNLTTLGYIVPLAEVEEWLKTNMTKEAQTHTFALNLLNKVLENKYKTEQNQKYKSELFPYYEIDVPDEWEIGFMNDTTLLLNKQEKGLDVYLELSNEVLPYEITDEFIDYLLKKIEKYKSYYTNYQRETVELHGEEAIQITYDFSNYRNYYVLIPFENVLFSYNYRLPLKDLDETQNAVLELLETVSFSDLENNTKPYTQTFAQTHPEISLQTNGKFYISPVLDSQEDDLILNIFNPDSFEQSFQLLEQDLEKDSWDLSIEEISKADIKQKRYSNPNFKLINRYDDIVLDGLKGYAYTYSYQGDDFNQTRKRTHLVVLKGKKYFRFTYDDLENNYDENIGEVIKILKTFQYAGFENEDSNGKYELPAFQELFGDIKYHLYEKSISVLVDKEILPKTNQYYYPEQKMNRLEAVEAIINSKVYVEEKRGLEETKAEMENSDFQNPFEDLKASQYSQELAYALEKEIIKNTKKFTPNRGVTLAEMLKILCETYELPVWDPPYRNRIQWYVPYIYKGRRLGLIPAGVAFDEPLSKGEFAEILYDFLQTVADQDDF